MLAAVAFLLANVKLAHSSAAGAYTYYQILGDDKRDCTQVEVRVRVENLDVAALGNKLFFPAMQTNLGKSHPQGQDGGHVGLQLVNAQRQTNWGGYFREFTTEGFRYTPFLNQGPSVSDEKKISNPHKIYHPEPNVNLRIGHFDPGTYTQVNQWPSSYFDWQPQTDYKYIVSRGEKKGDYWAWQAQVIDVEAKKPYYLGSLYSKESYIDSFLVWVETSIKDSTHFDVRWSHPRYMTRGTSKTPAVSNASVSKALYDSVVAPQDPTKSNAKTIWHRNGIKPPSDIYKAIGFGGDDKW